MGSTTPPRVTPGEHPSRTCRTRCSPAAKLRGVRWSGLLPAPHCWRWLGAAQTRPCRCEQAGAGGTAAGEGSRDAGRQTLASLVMYHMESRQVRALLLSQSCVSSGNIYCHVRACWHVYWHVRSMHEGVHTTFTCVRFALLESVRE